MRVCVMGCLSLGLGTNYSSTPYIRPVIKVPDKND